jgi:hypothetical protein
MDLNNSATAERCDRRLKLSSLNNTASLLKEECRNLKAAFLDVENHYAAQCR